MRLSFAELLLIGSTLGRLYMCGSAHVSSALVLSLSFALSAPSGNKNTGATFCCKIHALHSFRRSSSIGLFQ